ncbi:hypothetical protein BT93_L2219 [Corymbia citriodora subsp. variegata]|uniref:Uncharacterized protein n=1 Tax=Corymbia citriodora subsp. variegata TaxID=360336 RepID=A0A8T0CK92_CORYI|nr:hypothetical protein BT93_L2219 [Corymbia citriodora subsp. variegata]
MLDQEEIATTAAQGNHPMNIENGNMENVNTTPNVVAIPDTTTYTTDLEVGTENAAEVAPTDTTSITSAPIRRSSHIPKPSTRLRDFSTYHTAQHPIQDFIGNPSPSWKHVETVCG